MGGNSSASITEYVEEDSRSGFASVTSDQIVAAVIGDYVRIRSGLFAVVQGRASTASRQSVEDGRDAGLIASRCLT